VLEINLDLSFFQQEEPEIVLECLGVLNDLLKRFATLMDSDHEKIQKSILPHLTSTRVAARKRAIACLGRVTSHSWSKKKSNSYISIL